jgi:hypothetical protein
MTYYRKDYSHIEKTTGLRFVEGDHVRFRASGVIGTVMRPGRDRDRVYVRFTTTYPIPCAPDSIELVQRAEALKP